MEQLRNPLLAHLSVDDLNQRYADSYCSYFGEPRYIYTFSRDDNGVVLVDHDNINLDGRGNVQRVPFRWEGLNVARPSSGWYFVDPKKEVAPFHLAYPVKKQFKRGLSQRNTVIQAPFAKPRNTGWYFHSLLSATQVYNPITDDVFARHGSVIPRPDRALLWDGKQAWCMFLKSKKIAVIKPKENLLQFLVPNFEQELAEVSQSRLLDSLRVELYTEPPLKVGMDLEDILKDINGERRAAQVRPEEWFAEERAGRFPALVPPRGPIDRPILRDVENQEDFESALVAVKDKVHRQLRLFIMDMPWRNFAVGFINYDGFLDMHLGGTVVVTQAKAGYGEDDWRECGFAKLAHWLVDLGEVTWKCSVFLVSRDEVADHPDEEPMDVIDTWILVEKANA